MCNFGCCENWENFWDSIQPQYQRKENFCKKKKKIIIITART